MRSTSTTRVPVDAHRLAHVCRLLDEKPDVGALLRYIAELALEFSPAAEHAVVDALRRGVLSVATSTSEVSGVFEAAQIAANAGPVPTVGRNTAAGVVVADWELEKRWPALVHPALDLGIRAQHSYPLVGRRGTIGVVSVYAMQPDAFGTGTGDAADPLADVLVPCGIAYAAAQLEADLRCAVASRDTIGQAKGILMERLRIGPDEAFGLLISVSQRSHRKLHDVADDVARTGQLDETA